MEITTVGIDLAKNVSQVHAVDQHGKVVLKKQIKRDLTNHVLIIRATRAHTEPFQTPASG